MPRAGRVCSQPGCPTMATQRGKCDEHARTADRERGTRGQRGYGAAHDQLRAWWAPRVAQGTVACSRCSQPIRAGSAWHLDHDDGDRTQYRGPSHANCNLSAAGRRSHG